MAQTLNLNLKKIKLRVRKISEIYRITCFLAMDANDYARGV
jgi:hypothetical protein